MKKSLFFVIWSAVMSLAMANAALADDVICEGNVAYKGGTIFVSEDGDTIEEAKLELIEEACDKICRGLDGVEEDRCENACEREAVLVGTPECRTKSRHCNGQHNCNGQCKGQNKH